MGAHQIASEIDAILRLNPGEDRTYMIENALRWITSTHGRRGKIWIGDINFNPAFNYPDGRTYAVELFSGQRFPAALPGLTQNEFE
jgi:hypothetical protein